MAVADQQQKSHSSQASSDVPRPKTAIIRSDVTAEHGQQAYIRCIYEA
jgi:hypothetical protein